MEIIAETERLLLREWRPEDAGVLLSMTGDPDVMLHIGDRRPWESIERAEAWLGRVEASYRERGYGFWAVVEKSSGREIGSCGFGPRPGAETVEFGYLYARHAWGRGYATEAGREVLRHGFENLGFGEVIACTTPEHAASRRVLEKLGFEFVGISVMEGEDEESAVYRQFNPKGRGEDDGKHAD
ncbi:MAG TPA: GNAT family N-acetyltransferase [Pyrinomonadaceae bacterium]|jgi:RimJ/RimL family protein N-acetyltransferase|nr:GNAT family N-acetyltransferase [Pyrinomonadaceae bacterium]